MTRLPPDDDLEGYLYEVRDDLLRETDRYAGQTDDLTDRLEEFAELVGRLRDYLERLERREEQ